MKNKKAAMEMSMGTIVTIVLLVSVLILGLVFVRNVMCSGIVLTDQITSNVEEEIQSLFSVSETGVKCMGEGNDEIKLADGGSRKIGCIIRTDDQGEYSLKVTDIKSLSGVSTERVQDWVLSKDWEGNVAPGDKTVQVLLLRIPEETTNTMLEITIEEENLLTGTMDTHRLVVEITHLGAFKSTMC